LSISENNKEGITIKTIILLEDSSCIQLLIKDSIDISGEKIYIPLSPSASYAFDRSNILYKSMRDYGGRSERYQQGMENFQRIDRLVTVLDNELAYLHNIPTLTPARYSFHPLKMFIDVLWDSVNILKTIISAEQPDFIYIYTKFHNESEFEVYGVSKDESVYAKVLTLDGWNIPIKIITDIPDSHEQLIDKGKKSISPWFLNWIKKKDFFFNVAMIGKRDGVITAAKVVYYYLARRSQKSVLIYNCGYNWEDAFVELYRAGMYPIYQISDETFADVPTDYSSNSEISKVCHSNQSMREFDHILGIKVTEFFFARITKIIGSSIRESIISYCYTKEIISQKKIRCLLLSTRAGATGHAITQAARDAGVPVVSWQHGGAGYSYNPIMPFVEFINSDYHFVFGESVAENYQTTSDRIGLGKIPYFVPVGSSSLDNFWKRAKKSPKQNATRPIVYVSAGYLQNHYVKPLDPADWNEHVWSIQKKILDLARKYPEKTFVIKLYPESDLEPLISYTSDHQITNLKIITSEMTIRELTNIADFVIFDLISTGILQVLTSNLPVFVYTELLARNPETILELKKRTYVFEKISEFINGIEEYIQTGELTNYPIDLFNNDFLKKYGTDIVTHDSAEKAVAKLKEIVSAKDITR
jgi:hypothetical protein